MMNNVFENKSYLFDLERKNILKNISWIGILLLIDFIFFISLTFEGSFLMSLPFIIYGVFVILFLIKNGINLWMLNFANRQLDNHDLNINIYFKWIRKKIGLKIFTLLFVSIWIALFLIYQILFSFDVIEIVSFEGYTIFAVGSLVIFILQVLVNLLTNNQFLKLFEKTQNQMPWSKSFDLEISMTQKQAIKDYNQLILIIFATITILPLIIYFMYRYYNKIMKEH